MGEKLIGRTGYAIFALLLSWLFYWAPQSFGVFGGNDNFAHWILARYAWQHPELFLRMWGRPVYTFLFSFSAYGGIPTMKIFNTLLLGVTALVAADTAKRLGMKFTPWLAVLTLSVPLLFEMSVSAMTEITMALVVVGAVNLYFRKQFLWAALLISFSPFTRPEGWLFIAAMGGLFALLRNWRSIPWLAFGPVVMALIGWPVYGSPLWFLENNPYPMESPYGSGSPWTFVNSLPRGMNTTVLIGFVTGHITLWFAADHRARLERFALIVAPFWLYLIAHSYMWSKGILGSMGLVRVLASVMPLALIISWSGWNAVLRLRPKALAPLLSLLCLFTVFQIWRNHPFPKPEGGIVRISRSAGLWYRDSGYAKHKLYCQNSNILYFTEKDPFTYNNVTRYLPANMFPDLGENENGAFVLWDSRRFMTERISLDQLLDSPHFRLVQRFEPTESLQARNNGTLMRVYAFEKLDLPGNHDNRELMADPRILTSVN